MTAEDIKSITIVSANDWPVRLAIVVDIFILFSPPPPPVWSYLNTIPTIYFLVRQSIPLTARYINYQRLDGQSFIATVARFVISDFTV